MAEKILSGDKKNILMIILGIALASCSRREVPCEVEQVRPLTSYHIVKEGESLDSIAKKYNMSVNELCRFNGLTPSSWLVVGQRIFILPQRNMQTTSAGKPEVTVEVQNDEPSAETVASQVHKTEMPEENLEYKEFEIKKPNIDIIWPVTGRILKRFNEKLPNGTLSEGINIAAPANINVKACMDGTIMSVGELVHGFGNMVILEHSNGMISIYGHLQEIKVRNPEEGEKIFVKQGQVIGRVGKTGNVTVPQLHFQLRDTKATPVDPLAYLPIE